MSDPSSPSAAGSITDNSTLALATPTASPYSRRAPTRTPRSSAEDDAGVQIIDLSDPSSPSAAGNITDGVGLYLNTPSGIAPFYASGVTYAAVASYDDNGVQVLKLADHALPRVHRPRRPLPPRTSCSTLR